MIVTLRNGPSVLIRQVQAADVPLVADVFARLSPKSRWMRFLATKSHLTEAELHYLTDIDRHDQEVLATLDRPGGQGLWVARYIRDPTTRRPPRSPSQSSTTGTAGGLAPN